MRKKKKKKKKKITLSISTMGALPLSTALQAPIPTGSPSATPVDIIAPAPERIQTLVLPPQNYNTQTKQFNDNTVHVCRVFGASIVLILQHLNHRT